MIIEKLILEPVFTVLGVIILWLILHVLFVRICDMDEIIWIRFEYVWIFIGLIGLIILVDENRKNRSDKELDDLIVRINLNLEYLLSYSKMPNHCFQYNNTGVLPLEEFKKIQAEQDTICTWMIQVKEMVSHSIKKGNITLSRIPALNIDNYQKIKEYEHVEMDHRRINEQIKERDKLIDILENSFWNDMKYTFGILLMIIALSVRLTTVSKKTHDKQNPKQLSR